jgi:hypothetical protein
MALYTPPHTEKLLTYRIPQMKKQILAIAASSTTVLGLMATGVIGGTTALAGGTPTFVCENAPLEFVKVECIDAVHNITIELDVQNVLNGTQLNVLNGSLNGNTILSGDLNNVNILNGSLNGVQADVDIITVDVKNALNDATINLCQVHVDVLTVDKSHSSCH